MKSVLPIYQTGVRSEEYLTSSFKEKGAPRQNENSIIQVLGSYPPSQLGISNLTDEDIDEELGKIEFFSTMSIKERKKWLKDHSTPDSKLYLNHIPKLQIRFLNFSGRQLTERLGDPEVDKLSDGQYRPIQEVSALFDKTGSSARNKNMIFRGDNWTLLLSSPNEINFNGILITLDDGKTKNYKGTIDTNKSALIGSTICITTNINNNTYDNDDIYEILSKYPDHEKIQYHLSWASPSIFKSLIQKMIRTRCSKCEFLDDIYDGEAVLVVGFLMLIQHPGVFNERFQEFESGLQSATKRLGVTIAEDSHVIDSRDLLCMFASGYYAKTFKNWKPSAKLVNKWVDILLEAYNNIGIYNYKFDEVNLKIDSDPLRLCYHILQATKALQQDIPMVGWIAKNRGALNDKYTSDAHINVPLVHCIDQHNLTDIAWHVEYEEVEDGYPKFLRRVWVNSSSANGRKITKLDEGSEFLTSLRLAQYEVWILKEYLIKAPRLILNNITKVKVTVTLDDSWIAGLIEPIKIKLGKKNVVAVIDANNLGNIIVVPIPKRGDKDEIVLTDEETDDCIEIVRTSLYKGITITPPKYLKGVYPKMTIKLKKEKEEYGNYIVNGVDWDEFKHTKQMFPICEDLPQTRFSSCMYTCDGIEDDYLNKITNLLENLNKKCITRLLTYIETVESKIEMYRIDRDGKSVYYEVAPEDTAVYNFFCKLSVVVPAALEPTESKFTIKNGLLMSHLIQNILNVISTTYDGKDDIKDDKTKWKMPVSDGKILYKHQHDAVKRLKTDNKEGTRKQIINITVGLGKTLIIIRYVMHLIKNNLMPKYFVYSLPKSAIEGVKKQFIAHQMKINILDMNKTGNGNTEIVPYKVNFVYHDDMKKGSFSTDIGNISHKLLFVLDEMHFCLRASMRTSEALVASKISKYFIGMTGTLILDSDVDKLIMWLKLVSKFEVNVKNYWVAVGGLISSRIKTEISVIRKNEEIILTPEEKKVHDSSWNNAVETCYKIVTKALIKRALEYIKNGINVFIVTKDNKMQEDVADGLRSGGIKRIHLITKTNPINYEPGDKRKLQAVITTVRQSTGYTITGMYTMITSVYFSNEATREQLDGRLNRIGQPSKFIEIVMIHCGMLSYVLEKYEKVRSLADALRMFSKVVDSNVVSKSNLG